MRRREKETRGAHTSRRKRYLRKIWSSEKQRLRNGAKPNPNLARLGRIYLIRLVAPNVMGLHDPQSRPETVDFLHRIRDHSRTDGVGIHLDLSQLQKIYPSGAVMLLAEIDRAVANSKLRIVTTRPSVAVIDEVLQQIGIYQRLGINCEKAPVDENVIHWRSATGVLTEGEKGGTILLSYEGRLADGITSGLYEGMVEAMTNTVHHAYDGVIGTELKRRIGRRWWMLSQEKDGKLTVAICDLGIGIPRSLPRSRSFNWADVRRLWTALGLDNRDASAIKVAIEIGRSRTNQDGRGMGLADIVKAVDLSPNGGVHISSNKGSYINSAGSERSLNHATSIRGTLIDWQVPIAE